jgi:hypothetical protein
LLDVLSYIQYNYNIYDIEITGEFDTWLNSIQDGKTQKVKAQKLSCSMRRG